MAEVNYTVDGQSTVLDETSSANEYSADLTAPDTTGTYEGMVQVTQDGVSTFISSSDPRFSMLLSVNEEVPYVVNLKELLPGFMAEIKEFAQFLAVESRELDYIKYHINKAVDNSYIDSADEDSIERIEKFLGVVPSGSLEQRKDYLKVLYLNGNKVNKARLEEIVRNITGGQALIKFWTEAESGNPYPGYGYLEIKVLSPALGKDYNFSNVERAIKPLIAAHLKLNVMKWFATWGDINESYLSWGTIKDTATNWEAVYTFLPQG